VGPAAREHETYLLTTCRITRKRHEREKNAVTVPESDVLFEWQSEEVQELDALASATEKNLLYVHVTYLVENAGMSACRTRERLTGIYGLASSTSINRYH
jgi:hypothetical protein